MKGKIRQIVWLTAVALWILENIFKDKKDEWRRIATKANSVLKKAGLSNYDIPSFL